MKIGNNLRTIFWPFYKTEVKKLVPISVLMFSILFFVNMIRILRDSIMISELGAEVASFAKLYFVSPSAALFVILYAKLVNVFSFKKIYYYMTIFFVLFYSIFAFFIYPNAELIHLDKNRVQDLIEQYPHMQWYILLLSNWSYILFYTLSELTPNIFYLLLFWQLANEVTDSKEAKRFYPFFSFFGNFALIPAGFLTLYLASPESVINKLSNITSNKIIFVQISVIIVNFIAIISYILVRHICKNVASGSDIESLNKSTYFHKKTSMGLIESFKYISSSPYLWLMLICSASYGLSLNLVEAVWKAKINILYPSVNGYASFHAKYTIWTGILIMIMTIIGSNVMRLAGWFVTAVITPIIIMVTGIFFFVFVIFDEKTVSILDQIIIISPLVLAVNIGMVQNILAKGSKYSIWDTSRQMLYIPLDKELRSKGKAAVDIISPKVGKSLSGLLQSVLLTAIPGATVISIAPVLSIIFIIVCIVWVKALRKVYHHYRKIV